MAPAGTHNTSNLAYQFFTSNLFDLANFLVNCFKYGTFLKLIEFVDFIDAIRESFALSLCMSNYITTSVINTEPEAIAVNEDEMRSYLGQIGLKLGKLGKENSSKAFDLDMLIKGGIDNLLNDHNDKDILYNWENCERRKEIEVSYQELIDEQRSLIKMRFLMMHYLTGMLNTYQHFEKEGAESIETTSLPKIELALVEFNNLQNGENKSRSVKFNPFNPKSNYLERLNELNLIKLVNLFISLGTKFMTNKSFLDMESTETNNKHLLNFKQDFDSIHTHIIQKIDSLLVEYESNVEISLSLIARLIESLSGSLEVISFSLIIFVACLNLNHVKPIWNERFKKSKKKKDTYLKYSTSIEIIHEIYDKFCHLIGYYGIVLKDKLASAKVVSKCESLFAQVEATFKNSIQVKKGNATSGGGLNDISNSYAKSLDDLKKSFNSKLKILLKLSSNSTDISDYLENLKIKN